MADADHLAALAALLDRVHQTVMAGDLTALSPLAEQLDSAAARPLHAPDARSAADLRGKAQRNAACLAAAARGLRSAQRRLREIAAVAAGGSVYDGSGRAHSIAAPGRVTARL